MKIMEKVVAQAKVYFIIGYGRDATTYDDKKWVLDRVYMTEQRLIFKRGDRYIIISYGDIESLKERDKYFRVSPPMGWSRGSILEIRHYEDSSKKHILVSLISADFDVITKIKAIIGKFAFSERKEIDERHKKFLMLISLGIRDGSVIRYLLDMSSRDYDEVMNDLKLNGLITENLELTNEGRKRIGEIRKRI